MFTAISRGSFALQSRFEIVDELAVAVSQKDKKQTNKQRDKTQTKTKQKANKQKKREERKNYIEEKENN